MNSIQLYNNLDNRNVDRSEIIALLHRSEVEEQFHITKILEQILITHPDQVFLINIKESQVEIPTRDLIACLDCEPYTEAYTQGLAKPVSSNDIYDMITSKMIDLIAKITNEKWVKTWKNNGDNGTGYTIPFNFESKKRYRGINVLMLTEFEVMENPFFLTFKQIEKYKGKLRKGSKGKPVVYFVQLFKIVNKEKNIDFGTYDLEVAKKFLEKNSLPSSNLSKIPILKYYNVFNGRDIDGIDFDLENFKIGYINNEVKTNFEQNEIAETIIAHYPTPKPSFKIKGNRAFYSPNVDAVTMPPPATFITIDDYYRTLMHEYSHSTGHVKRLARDFSGQFGSKPYAFEELVAEFGATFLCAEAGIMWHQNINTATYLKGWNSKLTHIKDDPKFLMKAASKAQELADYVLQFNDKGDPLYFQFLKKDVEAKELPKTRKPKATIKPKVSKKPKPKKETKPKVKSDPIVKKVDPIVEPVIEPIKVDANGQTALFGTQKSLNKPAEQIEVVAEVDTNNFVATTQTLSDNQNVRKIGALPTSTPSEFYTVSGEIGKFLQQVEKKPTHSVVITLDGEQGAGKTTMLYKMMDAFAYTGNKCLFISGEEHPDSSLAIEKAEKYLSNEAKNNIDTVAEVETVEELYSLINPYEIIFIDSWQKLLRMIGNIKLDEDLRKRFNGKVFVIIFQQTTTGRTKGGSEVVFDGDIITKLVKGEQFSKNYAYFDKNRYTKVPLETIRYNVADGVVYDPNPATEIEDLEEEISIEPIQFKFKITEN